MDSTLSCPCGSGKEYIQCCKPFHQDKLPENALQLMRSRYTAYVLNIPEYIIETTHPASPQYSKNLFSWKRSLSQFSKHSDFQKLEVLDFKEKNTLATVTFTAHLTQEGQDATFTERSHFEKLKGRWFYRWGELEQGFAPNLVTTGQLRLLPLAYFGNPILKMQAKPVKEITNDLKNLVEEMIETMDACDGIGLAAPQVHHSIRLFIIRTPIESEDGSVETGEVKVFINPVLSQPSDEKWDAPEGCLSIPTLRAAVKRPKEVTVDYTSLDGSTVKERFSGWAARVVQHEFDHIEGILFVDRLEPEAQSKLKPFLEDLEKRIYKAF